MRQGSGQNPVTSISGSEIPQVLDHPVPFSIYEYTILSFNSPIVSRVPQLV